MTTPPNPNRLRRRTLGEIKNALLQHKDRKALGTAVREIMERYETQMSLMQVAIVKHDAEARALKGAAPVKQEE